MKAVSPRHDDIRSVALALLDAIDGTLARMSAPPETHAPPPALPPLWRWTANLLGLWRLCDKPACRRAQRCKCAPHLCLARHAPLLPEDVRAGASRLLAGKARGLSYDALCAQAPDAVAALATLHRKPARATSPPWSGKILHARASSSTPKGKRRSPSTASTAR